jgi:hypothetical protein
MEGGREGRREGGRDECLLKRRDRGREGGREGGKTYLVHDDGEEPAF